MKLRASAKLGAIAVDESVVKCGGRPVYVWVAVDACATHLVRCFTHKDNRERAQVSRLRTRCLGDSRIGVHGSVKP
ncbi:hypothetical protein B9Q11_02440 [Candidatus Marsarchaeota G2 archaeon ECH_B_SAG-F08]|uniref:DDE domain-containing protein n=1 Tax=Candidatus Marsarchaeota G2 archaeon ECH_B_SAG-F08 TaxID=1978165 RepID=A0A2R6BI33_9ARCH|nr:MAG: hypothetical protein B9Q11_02440 [Candidatus Marsarchaeota G2 archaeon ECH_B_SAG-F08]